MAFFSTVELLVTGTAWWARLIFSFLFWKNVAKSSSSTWSSLKTVAKRLLQVRHQLNTTIPTSNAFVVFILAGHKAFPLQKHRPSWIDEWPSQP